MPRDLKDKASKAIREGDQVWTPVRGGKHQGPVGGVVRTEEEAQETGTKNPPKVLFTDQHGHKVAHNPETLSHVKD
ncbi:hypothetical protein J3459_017044 [Metarhizium acridum]|nr:hypothetical protein J3459_017044 [Metarhizium acridum]